MSHHIKQLSIVLLVFIAMPLTAQTLHIEDFENGQNAWNSVSCATAWAVNPDDSGINRSCGALMITRSPWEDNWSGAILNLDAPITSYRYVHVLMYRNNTNLPNIKVYDPEQEDGSADLKPITTDIQPYQWQDVVFDVQDHPINFIFFMVDRTSLSNDAWMYIDDVQLSNDPTPRTTPNTPCGTSTDPSDEEYTLVWNEDFTDGSFDDGAWNIEVNGDGGGNNELQYYCEKAVSIAQHPTTGKQCLVLTATKEQYMDRTCTSGRVNSKGKTYFQYGKIEARIHFPQTANGLWPAFWMMGNDFDQVGWPACGETDIIELGNSNGIKYGTQERYFNGANHWGPRWDQHYQDAASITYPYSVEDGFHVFTCIWDKEHIAMYVDRDKNPNVEPYYEISIDPSHETNAPGTYFHKPNFILLNLAVGGNFPAIWDINQITALATGPRSMYIDWVRIYQKGDEGEVLVTASDSDNIEPEDDTATITPFVSFSNNAEKVLISGQIYILHNNQLYILTGQKIQ